MGHIPSVLRQWYYVTTLVCLLTGQRVEAASKYAFEEYAPPRLMRSEQTQTITTIWEEDFESSANDDVSDTGPTAWALISSSINNTSVKSKTSPTTTKVLASSGDEAVWASEDIDISAHTNVRISVDLSSDGTLEGDDYLQVYYQLDGALDEIPLLNGRWFGNVEPTTAMIGSLNGNSIRIIVKFKTSDVIEEYTIDNIQVYTEPSERHAISNGNWNDGSTWSYTAGGTTCNCTPDILSDTYIDGYTVGIADFSNTHNLSVNGGGVVEWTATKNLRLWGDASLVVELGSEMRENGGGAYLSFNQWNYRETHAANQTPADLGYPGVSATINVDQPAGFLISGLQLNAAGTFSIQGAGNIQTTLDLDVTHQANITNDLVGNLIVGDDFKIDFPGASFTNNQNVQVAEDLRVSRTSASFVNNGDLTVGINVEMSGDNTTFSNNGDLAVDDNVEVNSNSAIFTNTGDMIVDKTLSIDQADVTFANDGNLTTRILTINQSDNTFTNQGDLEVGFNLIIDATNNLLSNSPTGTIEVKIGTLQLRGDSEVVNEGVLETFDLATNATVGVGGGEITNRQMLTINGSIFNNTKPLTIYNYGDVNIEGGVLLGVDDKLELYNYEDANWYFGGGVSSAIKLYAGAPNNTIHYDGVADQTIITPQDAYWHLTLANSSTTGTTSVKTPSGSILEINGDLTIESSPSGPVLFEVSTNHTDINLAGDWWRKAAPRYTSGSLTFNETVTFDGSNDQRLRTYEAFVSIEVNKTGQLLIEEGSSIAGTATFSQGVVVAQNNQPLVFRPSGLTTGASDASHVVGSVTKQGSADFTFPVGDGTHYRPLTLNDLSTASHFTTEYHRANPTTDGYSVTSVSSPLLNVSACEYWEVERTNGTAEALVTLTWDDTSCPVELGDLTIVRWDGTQWVAVPSVASGTASGGSITTNARQSVFGIFTLTEQNDAPVANDDAATTQKDTAVVVSVLQNDTDRNGIDPASVSVVVGPQHGTIIIDPATGVVTYTPNPGFSGTDSFRYTIQDIKGLTSAEATVTVTVTADEPTPTVTVNTAPVAQPDAFVTNEDQPLSGNLASNDTDQEQDALSFSLDPDHQPAHGTATVNPSGTFVYTPDSNFFGSDQFVYTLCDDGEPSRCDTARVTLQVLPVNDAPLAVDDAFTVVENDTIIGNVATNDTDPDGDPIGGAVLLSAPANGAVTFEPNGRFTYQPDPHYVGADQFSYRICDDQTPPLCDEAEVTIQVQAGLLNVPKAFSPNQDQINDTWIIPGIRAYPNNTVTIFNRWGNAIYRARGYNNQTTYWQGTASEGIVIGNQPLPDGTYFYVIDLGEGKKPMSGYVLLKR